MERGDRGLRLCTVDLEASFLARVASHCSARSGFARCSVLAASRRRRRRSRRGVAVETAGARCGLAARGGKPRRPECAGFRVSSRGGLPPRGMTGTTPRPAAEGFRKAAAPVPARSASTPSMARFTRSSLDSTPRARSAGSESRPGRMGEAGGSGRGPGPWPAIAGRRWEARTAEKGPEPERIPPGRCGEAQGGEGAQVPRGMSVPNRGREAAVPPLAATLRP